MLNEVFSKKLISVDLYNIIKSDLNSISDFENSEDVVNFVERTRLKNQKLSSADFQVYLNFLSTLKHSSIFWEDAIENGTILMSDGTPIIPSTTNTSSTGKIDLPPGWRWKYWASDGVGALCGGPLGALGASACYAISIL